MQVWTDLDTGKTYKIDPVQGTQSPSNRFGKSPSKFTAYTSGFPRTLSQSPLRPDHVYSVQPSKFDGYSQFPRPLLLHVQSPTQSSNKLPTIRKQLTHLTPSAVYDKSITPPKLKKTYKSFDSPILTISEELQSLRKSANTKSKDIKTVEELGRILNIDKEKFRPYVKKKSREERRKLKGYFMKEFLNGVDLYEKERSVVKKTNLMFFERLRHLEEVDRKNLEKRKLQKLSQMRRE